MTPWTPARALTPGDRVTMTRPEPRTRWQRFLARFVADKDREPETLEFVVVAAVTSASASPPESAPQ